MPTISDKITHWEREIDRLTSDFVRAFGTLSPAQLNWQPRSGIWSIALIIDHLITVNESYFPIPDQLRAGTYRLPLVARWGGYTRWMGRFILKAVEPTRARKMKTLPVWEPTQSELPGDMLARFEAHQQQLAQLIRSSEDLLQQGVVISSPANRSIVYSLETAFDIIITHEARHYNQAVEVWQMQQG
ncbi:MAG: hypothetical protein OHK0039_36020 [Bacteroidia bacterium]